MFNAATREETTHDNDVTLSPDVAHSKSILWECSCKQWEKRKWRYRYYSNQDKRSI